MRTRLKMRPALGVAIALLLSACGKHEGPGEVTRKELPAALIARRAEVQREASSRLVAKAEPKPAKQILFGDLHVHTTFSADAFMRSLPLLQGEGAHPPADACDFARFCSQLDFWSINDHSEVISPRHWKEIKETIRQCNAVAGDPKNPDVVAFLGWEWTQVGGTPEDHYGHKNVIFKDTAEDEVPTRPISALNDRLVGAMRQQPSLWKQIQFPLFDFSNRQRYFDFGYYQRELADVPMCADGVDTRELPSDCHEKAETPQILYEKLSQWGFDTIVIPHGNTWGLYTPAGSTWDKQLKGAQHDPEKQTLIEVFSGHGNSEEYREWRAVSFDANGDKICPEPRPNFLPCCWQAGEIIRTRCGDVADEECERRVREARKNFLEAGTAGRQTLPGTPVADWLDCDQCRDCFNPSFNYRPGGSSQYALAISNFDDENERPRRFRFGFLASSDNHTARPGTGYKEYGRRWMTEATGARDEASFTRLVGETPTPAIESRSFDPQAVSSMTQRLTAVDFERAASFFLTGGLVAVHSEGRDRDAIWSALKQREVYGTSGERILLWFDLLAEGNRLIPMGSEVELAGAPRFRVRAVGSFKQKPGCPDVSLQSLSPERLQYLCRGECYHPSDERNLITRIEIIRIRPQIRRGEAVGDLIEDPWRIFPCPSDPAGCVVEFSDPEYAASGRDAVYYARAIQQPSPAVNAANLRCTYDDSGECIEVDPCYGDYRTPFGDDCLSQNEERAWSSPIYVNRPAPGAS